MRMLCLWLVNQLFALTIIVFFLGAMALGAVVDPDSSKNALGQNTTITIFVIAAIVGLIPAIFTAKFAKANFYDMISSGFIRWTSSISLWQSEWKFFFKTLFLGWLFYGLIALFIELIVCTWLGLK